VITAVARLYAPLSQQGRIWPRGEAFEGELHIDGYSLDGTGYSKASRVALSKLFNELPVAALKATYVGAAKPIAKRSRQFA
jgi:(1->4)-alpha-D-glucan 1-alpha-D-glucosylmutase